MKKSTLVLLGLSSLLGAYLLYTYLDVEKIGMRLATPTDTEFVDWRDLKPGQQGFGLTVFKGEKPEKFYVKFEDVTNHPIYPKEKVILVRMGQPLEGSDVLAGMSGSPVYFKHNGKWKLAGAIAFSFGVFSTENSLGGITPIQAMVNQGKAVGLENLPAEVRQKLNLDISLKSSGRSIDIGSYKDQPIFLLRPRITVGRNSKYSHGTSASETVTRPKPGEAVAMVLVDGDYQLAATCTVTYVTENEFWACGHPFLGRGKVVIPAHRGVIATSFKSHLYAYKMLKEYNQSFGFIDFDYIFAVRGKIAALPKDAMLKNNVSVTVGKSPRVDLVLHVLRDRLYSQRLIDGLVWDFLENLWPGQEKATVAAKTVLNFCDRESITFNDSTVLSAEPEVSWWSGYISTEKTWPIGKSITKLGTLMNSDWEFGIESINMDFHLEPGEKVLKVDSYALLDANNKPTDEANLGDELKLVLGLRNSEPTKKFVVVLPVKIPKNLELKKTSVPVRFLPAILYVESGNQYREKDMSRFLGHEPDNSEEFLSQLLLNEKDHSKIYLQLVLPPTVAKSTDTSWPKLETGKWVLASDLSFLRKAKSWEVKVFTEEISSPQKEYLPQISLQVGLKINLPQKVQKAVSPKKKKKSSLLDVSLEGDL